MAVQPECYAGGQCESILYVSHVALIPISRQDIMDTMVPIKGAPADPNLFFFHLKTAAIPIVGKLDFMAAIARFPQADGTCVCVGMSFDSEGLTPVCEGYTRKHLNAFFSIATPVEGGCRVESLAVCDQPAVPWTVNMLCGCGMVMSDEVRSLTHTLTLTDTLTLTHALTLTLT